MRYYFPFALALSVLSLPAVAQETSEEGVLVTGSRIPYESAGLVAQSGSPIDTTGTGCAEPNCGMGPEDPSGGRYLNIAAKGQQNKRAKQKLQQKKAVVAQPVKNTKTTESPSLWETALSWLGNITVTHTVTDETETSTGKILRDKRCTHIDMSKQKGPNPCVEKKLDVEKVQKANGDLTNQLQLSFVVYEQCYYEKKCGPDYITFIAETPNELRFLLNDALGENHF